MRRIFPGPNTLAKIPNSHAIYRSFFRFPDGPPQTSHELNGWGDDMVHDYLKGVERRGRLGVIYSNKDYGCEWDYDWRNKRFRAEDNTRFAVNLVAVHNDVDTRVPQRGARPQRGGGAPARKKR